MGFAPINQRRLSDDIVSQLEALIFEGSLQVGERLPAERALAERFGVSRPSLREAIQKLVAKGLLVSRQGGAQGGPEERLKLGHLGSSDPGTPFARSSSA